MFLALPLYDDNPVRRIPFVTYALITLCAAVFLCQLGEDAERVDFAYGAIPAVLFGGAHIAGGVGAAAPWATIFTSMFLHSGWLHLGGNMLFLWIFGNNIEDVLGHGRYVLLYLASGAAAVFAQAAAAPESTTPMIGASGAIAGVLGAYLVLYPRANVEVLLWVAFLVRMVMVPAWILLGLWFGVQLVSGLAAAADEPGVAFWAHVGGFVAGLVLLALLRPRGLALWQHGRTAPFVTVPPTAFRRRSSPYGRGSVPDAGPRYRPPPRGPWG